MENVLAHKGKAWQDKTTDAQHPPNIFVTASAQRGSRSITDGGRINFDVYLDMNKAPDNLAVTIAHENFVHLQQHIDIYAGFYRDKKFEDARNYRRNVELKDWVAGTTDHRNYSQGKGVGHKLMMEFGRQNPRLMPLVRENINKYKRR